MTSVDEASNDKAESNGKPKTESQAEVKPPNDLEAKIIRQIEYYFGDANLPRDKFMLEQIKLDDGWIPMSTMLKFQRLSNIAKDPKEIFEALKKSHLMEVDASAEDPKIRRSPEHPLPELNEERRKEIFGRTVYCKGFPLDATLDSVMAVFEEYGPTDNIIMRKYKDSVTQKFQFKGSIFATFPSKEKAQAFLDIPSVKVGETELIRMFGEEYTEKKKQEMQTLRMKKKTMESKGDGDKTEALPPSMKKGATIKLDGEFKPETTREDIKAAFTELELDVAYIGFNKGDPVAYVRLNKENSAKEALEKMENSLTIHDVKLSGQALEGKEEEDYLRKSLEEKKAFQKRAKGKKGFKGKRRGGRDDDGPRDKKRRQND